MSVLNQNLPLKKVAIVILNWNGRALLEKFLPSVVLYSKNAAIYVADNASGDDSVNFVTQNFPEVRIIQNQSNLGFAKGYNQALRQVGEEILVLLNSDVEVTPNWLEPVVAMFDALPEVAAIQPKIRDYKNKSLFEYAGAGGGFIDRFGYPFCRGRIFATIETDFGQYDDQAKIFWASGACFFIRRDAFLACNGFDGDFFAHQEEIDLCWRLAIKGYEVRFCSQSTVYHVGGATLNDQNPQKTYLNFRNSLLMLLKNLPAKALIPIIFGRLLLDGLAGIQFLAQGRFRHTVAIVRAHLAFYQMANRFYAKRGKVVKTDYYQTSSIVYQYYLRGRKHYNDLF